MSGRMLDNNIQLEERQAAQANGEESNDQSDFKERNLTDTEKVLDAIEKGSVDYADYATAIDSLRQKGLLEQVVKEGKTFLMLAAENGRDEIVNSLISAGAKVDFHLEKERETALTLVREERVLVRLAQAAGVSKIKTEHEDKIREYLDDQSSPQKMDHDDYIKMFEKFVDLTGQRNNMGKKFHQVSTYTKIRKALLMAGGYNVKNILHQETRKKIRRILINTKESDLVKIVEEKKHGTDALFSMLDLLASDDSFKYWPSLLPFLPEISDRCKNSVLHCLAKAANVSALHTLLKPSDKEDDRTLKDFYGKQNKDNNTFMHIYAQNHNFKVLFSNEIPLPKSLEDTLTLPNNEGKSFMAIAISNVSEDPKDKQEDDKALCAVMDKIDKVYGKETVSLLCKMTDTRRNNLLHVAGQKSLKRLVAYLLPRTTKEVNKDGLNLLHVAVYKNDTELIKTILNTEVNYEVNDRTSYGETALHIAAKQGYLDVLDELIRHGGDLSAKDRDKHTPLHDCLQQVYFEGGCEEEVKCEKFIKVWNKVVEQAVTWWCQKQNDFTSLRNEAQYVTCQIKAVYFLRSCLKNRDGLSVLQYAASRGLVRCVQAMLATKDVFAISGDESNSKTSANRGDNDFNFKIDITNLCPEYFVSTEHLYGEELKAFENGDEDSSQTQSTPGFNGTQQDDNNQQETTDETPMIRQDEAQDPAQEGNPTSDDIKAEDKKAGDKGEEFVKLETFVEALANVQPSNKAGEILELIPMITLTKLQWRNFQWFSIIWLLIHFSLMILVTQQSRREVDMSKQGFLETSKFDIPILSYSTLIAIINFLLVIKRWPLRRKMCKQAPNHEVMKADNGIFSIFTTLVKGILDQTDLIVELFFAGFTWAVYVATVTDVDINNYIWIKGFFLLAGWLLLLIPLRSYSPVYKLLSVLKHITITDMFPWFLLYLTTSAGFASAIQLQFQLLPGNTTCLADEHDLKEVLHQTGNALFELVIMTTGLDTDLKHVRNLACLFEYNNRSVSTILTLVTFYAVISAVVLLNMLIAIMSNTVTEAQQSKGWRQYQVYQALWLRDVIDVIKKISILIGQCCGKLFRGKCCSNRQSEVTTPDSQGDNRLREILKQFLKNDKINKKGKRWYLKLKEAEEVKAIRAVIWQQNRE